MFVRSRYLHGEWWVNDKRECHVSMKVVSLLARGGRVPGVAAVAEVERTSRHCSLG